MTGITLSGMINVLNGPASKDGRIVLMTSNAPDSLDSALIRPGRCDRKILFGYAGTEICVKLFTHIHSASPEEKAAGQKEAVEQHDIAALAKEFPSKIPAGSQISPAEVQGYLMLHRNDPLTAIAGVEAFAQQIIDIKARSAKVAAFDNEVDKKENGADAEKPVVASKDKTNDKADVTSESDAKSESATEPEAETGAEPKSSSNRGDHLSLPSSPVFGNGWLDLLMRAHGIDASDFDAMVQWKKLLDTNSVDFDAIPRYSSFGNGSEAGSPVSLEEISYDDDEHEGEDRDEGDYSSDDDDGEDEGEDDDGEYDGEDADEHEGKRSDAIAKEDAKAERREQELKEMSKAAPGSEDQKDLMACLLAAKKQVQYMSGEK